MPLSPTLAVTLGILAVAALSLLVRRKDRSGTANGPGAALPARGPVPVDLEAQIAERTRFWNASDRALFEWLLAEAAADAGVQVTRDPVARMRLVEAAEKVHRELESAVETEVNLPFLAADPRGPRHFVRKVRRDQWIL